MRTVYRRDPQTGKMIEVYRDSFEPLPSITPDIKPYKSMITGEMITGRSQHREHLKRHGVQEVGNECHPSTFKPREYSVDKKQLVNDIREATRQLEWGETPTRQRLREESPRMLKELGLDG